MIDEINHAVVRLIRTVALLMLIRTKQIVLKFNLAKFVRGTEHSNNGTQRPYSSSSSTSAVVSVCFLCIYILDASLSTGNDLKVCSIVHLGPILFYLSVAAVTVRTSCITVIFLLNSKGKPIVGRVCLASASGCYQQ